MNFENWCNGELSKIGHYFSYNVNLKNDVIKKCLYQKNVLLNWYPSMKKELRKIPTISDIENCL